MLKKLRKRRKSVVLAYAEFRRAARRNPRASGVVLAALIFSSAVMFSPLFSAMAHPEKRLAAPRAGMQGASAQSGTAQDQEEGGQELDGWERPIVPLPKDRKSVPCSAA